MLAVLLLFRFSGLVAQDASSPRELDARWREIATQHVRIVYQQKDESSAREIAGFAETVYRQVTSLYDSSPQTVLCVLRSDTEFANGLSRPDPPHIEINTTAPAGPWLGASTESWLKAVFVHELAHYVQFGEKRGLFGTMSRALGPGVAAATGAFTPGWMIEGPAVAAETLFTDGGRGRNPFFHLYARGLLFEERLFNLARAANESRFPPPGRIYLAGYLISDYLLDTYGEQAFRDIVVRFFRFPFMGPWRAIRVVTGSSAREIFGSMKQRIAGTYFGDAPPGRGGRVTPARVGDYHLPRRTRAGWYMYRTRLDRPSAIVRFDPETGEEDEIVVVSLSDAYSFTADATGSFIVFASPVFGYDARNAFLTSDLFLYDTARRTTERLTRRAGLRHPELSPDGAVLVAVKQEASFASLVEIDREDATETLLLRIPETNLYTPRISSDGRRVVFSANRAGVQDIGALALDVPRGREIEGAWNVERVEWITDTPRIAEYYPVESDGVVTFGADGATGLELRVREPDGETRTVVRDPVGAFAGFRDSGSWVYASYSADGFAVFRRPVAPEIETTGSTEPPDIVAGGGRRGRRAVGLVVDAPKRYVDFPRLVLWLPLPFAPNPFPADPAASEAVSLESFALAPGLLLFFRSPVRGHTVTLEGGVLPDVGQPTGTLDVAVSIGKGALSFSLTEAYREQESGAAQTTELRIGYSAPLLAYARFPISRSLSAGWSARYRVDLEDELPFAPFAAGVPAHHLLSVGADATARLLRRGSSLHARPPWELSVDGRAEVTVVRPDETYPVFSAKLTSTGTLPPGRTNHLVSASVVAGYRSSPVSEPVAVPNGGWRPGIDARSTDALATLSYLPPTLPTDLPLPFGYHLGSIGARLSAQGYASLTASPMVDPTLYASVEIEFGIGKTVHFPVALGAAVRLRTGDPSGFTLGDDLRIYVSSGGITGTITGRRSNERNFRKECRLR